MCEITEKKVSETLRRMGVPVSLIGFSYIKTAIMLIAEDEEYLVHITKMLYPTIAEKHNTTSTRAERAIRFVIEKTYLDGDMDVVTEIIGATGFRKGKPTNSEFLGGLYEYLKYDEDEVD